jgi:hypothetical protein
METGVTTILFLEYWQISRKIIHLCTPEPGGRAFLLMTALHTYFSFTYLLVGLYILLINDVCASW